MTPKTIPIKGHAYFVTSKVAKNLEIFLFDEFCHVIINNLNFYRKRFGFKLLGYVIMLDHLHYIIWPQGKYTISDILRNFKEYSAKQIIRDLKNNREALAPRPELSNYLARAGLGPRSSQDIFKTRYLLKEFQRAAKNIRGQQYKLWQSRNWIENIYSEKFLRQKLNYIHHNPVRAGLVEKPEDYKYSSYNNYYLNDYSIIKIDKI